MHEPIAELNILICHLPLPPLSEEADEQLTRICTFLYGINRPAIQISAMLAGYTRETHSMGSYIAGWMAGERGFWEWRTMQSVRPSYDPDLPELVDELDRFAQRWAVRARLAAGSIVDEDDRAELQQYLGDLHHHLSRTSCAKGLVDRITHLGKVLAPFYQHAWSILVEEGIEKELPRFREVLTTVQKFIADAPLDEREFDAIQKTRESFAKSAENWLRDRREQLRRVLTDETLIALALGDLLPTRMPEVPFRMLTEFRIEGRA